MNILVLATNFLGFRILRFLLKQNDNILGVGLIKNNPYSVKIKHREYWASISNEWKTILY